MTASPLTAAEELLAQRVRFGGEVDCDLSADTVDITADMAQWGAERSIRVDVLESLLSQWSNLHERTLVIQGAVILGRMRSVHVHKLARLVFRYCRFDHGAEFKDLTFDGRVSFAGSVFQADTRFTGCTFNDEVRFSDTTFTSGVFFTGTTFNSYVFFEKSSITRPYLEYAVFNTVAYFPETEFHGHGWFDHVTFKGDATFSETLFHDDAFFTHTTFDAEADFRDAVFARDAHFEESKICRAKFDATTFSRRALFARAEFTRLAWFCDTIFCRDGMFERAILSGEAMFIDATFTDEVNFTGATFNDMEMTNACARHWICSHTQFLKSTAGPFVGPKVTLVGAKFAARTKLEVAASSIPADWLHAEQKIHCVFRSPQLTLSDSEFSRGSTLSSASLKTQADILHLEPRPPSGGRCARTELRRAAETLAIDARKEFQREINSLPLKTSVLTLERSSIGELSLQDVILDKCRFAGARGLDALRIGTDCSLQRVPRWWRTKSFARYRMFTRRQIIFEELEWRRNRHIDQAHAVTATPSSLEISSIYRDLRRALENAKNEPAAADFYYGEMEMRRLARPSDSALHGRKDGSSPVERALLTAYWAASGYGLRASRALALLAAILLGAAVLYTHPTFASLPAPPREIAAIDSGTGAVSYSRSPDPGPPDFVTALEYSVRESISLVGARDTSALKTTGWGTLLDFMLRLAGPALLALAVLAIRGRTKR